MVGCDDKVQPGQNERCSPAARVRHGGVTRRHEELIAAKLARKMIFYIGRKRSRAEGNVVELLASQTKSDVPAVHQFNSINKSEFKF